MLHINNFIIWIIHKCVTYIYLLLIVINTATLWIIRLNFLSLSLSLSPALSPPPKRFLTVFSKGRKIHYYKNDLLTWKRGGLRLGGWKAGGGLLGHRQSDFSLFSLVHLSTHSCDIKARAALCHCSAEFQTPTWSLFSLQRCSDASVRTWLFFTDFATFPPQSYTVYLRFVATTFCMFSFPSVFI